MRRELKVELVDSGDHRIFQVAKHIPMRRELKVGSLDHPHVIKPVAKHIPMRRELKALLASLSVLTKHIVAKHIPMRRELKVKRLFSWGGAMYPSQSTSR